MQEVWRGYLMAGNDIKILFKKMRKNAIIPEYKLYGDAGCDLCAVEDTILKPGERKVVWAGFSIEMPQENIEAQIRPRSGLAIKHGVTVLNTPGTVDYGYRGEIGAIMVNLGDKDYAIHKGDRFAQMVFSHVYRGHFIEVHELSETDRSSGGMGHTGVK